MNPNERVVEAETLFGCDADVAEARGDFDLIARGVALDGYPHSIEVGVIEVPQSGIFDREGDDDGFAVEFGLYRFGCGLNSVRIERFEGHAAEVVAFRDEVDFGLGFGPFGRYGPRVDQDSRRAQIQRRYGGGVGDDEFYLPADAAVDVVDGRERQHVARNGVAHGYAKQVFAAVFHPVGDFEDESGRSAPVLADVSSVYEEVGDALHAVEFQEEPLSGPGLRYVEFALIVGGRAQVWDRPGQCIEVPGVRQRDTAGVVAAVFVAEREEPVVAERIYFAGLHTPGGDQQKDQK